MVDVDVERAVADEQQLAVEEGVAVAEMGEPKIRTTFFIFPKSMTIGDTLSWHCS